MVKSSATTVKQYLAELPADRRASIERVRDVVRDNLPEGYREMMGWGMISWGIPLETYPDTYNGQPLCYAALASQKNNMTLYLMGAYADSKERARLEKAYADKGKRLDMGGSCLHFKSADELPLDLIGELIASRTPAEFIALSKAARATSGSGRKKAGAKKTGAKKPGPKKAGAKKAGAKKAAVKKRAVKKGGARKR